MNVWDCNEKSTEATTLKPTTTVTTANPPKTCPENWLNLSENGCFYFGNESLPWFEAQMYCNNLNSEAYLAEVPSESLHLILVALASELPADNWWLGASDFYNVSNTSNF